VFLLSWIQERLSASWRWLLMCNDLSMMLILRYITTVDKLLKGEISEIITTSRVGPLAPSWHPLVFSGSIIASFRILDGIWECQVGILGSERGAWSRFSLVAISANKSIFSFHSNIATVARHHSPCCHRKWTALRVLCVSNCGLVQDCHNVASRSEKIR